jgi:chromatin assembly factor 1 subunit B
MWTPPLTPAHGHGGSHSASSSVSGIPNIGNIGRRESERSESDRDDALPGSRKRELQSVPEVEEARDSKKRRIAPVPVVDSDTAIASTEENTPTPVQE